MSVETSSAESSPQLLRDIRFALEPLIYRHDAEKEGYEQKVVALANQLELACRNDLEAALATILLDSGGVPFAANHSVNTALLVCALGLREQWAGDDMQAAICAAFTMNISYATQQDTMTTLGSDLTLLQKSSIESHSRLSHKLLTQKKIKNREWLNAVMQHHERPDGTGYLGMKGEAISKVALAISLADRFCMLTAFEGGGGALISETFLRQTVRHEPEAAATRAALGERLGMYLPGTMVNLASGEVGVVWRYTDETAAPLVSSLGTQGSLALDQGTVRDTREEEFRIEEVLSLSLVYNKPRLLGLWGCALSAPEREPNPATAA